MSNSTGIADEFYDYLGTSQDSGQVLTLFYCKLFKVQFTLPLKIVMNDALKLFGKYIVYFSIIDIFGMIDKLDDKNNPRPILFYFCKKRLEREHNAVRGPQYTDLTSTINRIEKKIKEINNDR